MTIHAVDVGMVSADDRLVAFYETVLAASRLEPRVIPMGTVHRLALGPVTLKIMVPADAPTAPPPTDAFWGRAGYQYVTLWVDDLDALAERWAASGGTITLPPFELRPGVRTAVLADPDGNAVEAMEERAE